MFPPLIPHLAQAAGAAAAPQAPPSGAAPPPLAAGVAPPAHQPKLEIPGASSKATSFSASEFYGIKGAKVAYPLPDCFTNESGKKRKDVRKREI